MLARSPTSGTDIDDLLDEVADEAFSAFETDHRPAFRAALRRAFLVGWQSHADAVDEATAKLRGLPSEEQASGMPLEDITETSTDMPAPVTEAPSDPAPNSQPDLILNLIKATPTGMTSLEVIDAVHRVDHSISGPSIRTSLHRLRLRRLIYNRLGKWFPARAGNAGGEAPAQT
jgi:hypothetical protein